MCCPWVHLKKKGWGLIVGPYPGIVLCRAWRGGQGPHMSEPVCVSVFVCACEWFGEGGWVFFSDKKLLGFLHLFSHSIGVRPPLPGLQSPGLLLWCQHEFASNLQRKNNNNKECVYPTMVLCMFSLICWNCVKLTSFKNVLVSNIRQLQAGRQAGQSTAYPCRPFFYPVCSTEIEKLLCNLLREKQSHILFFRKVY